MKAAKRIGLEVLGWGLLVAGLAMIFLPGPGLLGIFGGLAILSQQYEWAERRLAPVKYRALKGAAESVESPLRIAFSLLGCLFLVACAWVWWIGDSGTPDPGSSAPSWTVLPDWWFLPDGLWLIGGRATAVTLVASMFIALALLVYSYRRFHGKPEAVAELDAEIKDADEDYHEQQR
ncbi:PGPGW domain-containing protein [Nocardioides litoris]|uniref:PGPGW domain-containing protein n=1 Tax=Nocardioides litoris TaxID=1926648 RepID=UPI00111CE80B|nr:PGPGW domain-containing protein [Nocardioides litoris]